MIYRDFQGIKLSGLGFGAMRLPVVNGDDGNIDREQAKARAAEPAIAASVMIFFIVSLSF